MNDLIPIVILSIGFDLAKVTNFEVIQLEIQGLGRGIIMWAVVIKCPLVVILWLEQMTSFHIICIRVNMSDEIDLLTDFTLSALKPS